MIFPLALSLATSLTAAAAALPTPATAVAFDPALAWDTATASALPGESHSHELASVLTAGLDLEALIQAENVVLEEIRRGGFPGAALAVGYRGQVVLERGIGRTGWEMGAPSVDPGYSVYDLASLTKVVATTTAVMLLVEDRRIELDAPVSRYLPEFRGSGKALVTIRHLLTHTSGLPAWANIGSRTPEQALRQAVEIPLEHLPGERVEYSDIGFVVLWAAAERAAVEPLYRLLDRRVFGPLEMRLTTFLPGESCASCVPTAQRGDGTLIRGVVHDPIARWLGGIAGNAGLFSTAHDLARFAAMLANGGELDGVRILRPETIEMFTRRQPRCGTRALGWDTPDQDGSGAGGLRISPRAFGHTGFTGTSLWIDPDRGTWTVLLSNRTFEPKASNRIQALRRTVNDWVATAYDAGASVASSAAPAPSEAR